ncbi:hypothetical protein G7Y89_g11480 [Cudoniella acicularis]|uniref:Enoyl reductase (ER) domain-containing protein n=1 Tax=Cudoniella acicularis TaxID=354080 RepID=A0A8H4RBW4_9HELO|nr:hypothetical protein G7Y89_g11480 [Cudoniella acicularis]
MPPLSRVPPVVASAIYAINEKDNDKFVAAFSKSAIMYDEGKQHLGPVEIGEWCLHGLIEHNASIDVKTATKSGTRTILYLIMDGDFVADYGITEPFPLYFEFAVQDDKIQSLMITDWDSSQPSMRALWVNNGCLEDPISSIRIAPRPQQNPPPGWVKIQMEAVSLNYHDIFTMRGLGMHPLTFPLIVGCEGAGVLEDGTEVLLYPAMGDQNYKGDETLDPKRHVFSELTNGTLAEFCIAPLRNVVKRPKLLSAIDASVLGIAWLTAYRMLFTKSSLRAGQTMLVQGSSGGVTTALIQLGSAAGMRVWCTGRTAEKRDLGVRLGAEEAFAAGEELPEKVDVVFDTSGDVTWSHSMASVKTGGTIVTCGAHSGRTFPADLGYIFVNQLNIRGSYLGTLQEFKDLIAFVVSKGIKPHIGLVLPLEEADIGFQRMIEGKTDGKIVVTI